MGISWDEYYKEEAPVKKEEKVSEPRVAEVSEATKQAIEAFISLEPLPISLLFLTVGLNGFTLHSFIFPGGTTSV